MWQGSANVSLRFPLRRRVHLATALLLAAVAVEAQPPRFEDRSDLLTGDFSRSILPGILGVGGLAWLDYDGDGDLDLFVTNGSADRSNALYENRGEGGFVDVAAAAGVAAPGHPYAAVVAGDLDNDGFPDLVVLGETSGNFEAPRTAVLRNRGNGTFEDVSATAGVPALPDSASAALLDYDGNGLLDLFVTGFGSVGLPESFGLVDEHGVPVVWDARVGSSRLFRNLGGLQFQDVSDAAGVTKNTGGCAVAASDYDRDGDQDVLVANCNLITEGPVGGNCAVGFPCPVCESIEDPGPCRPEGSGGNPLPAPFNVWRNNGDGTFTDVAQDPATGIFDVRGAFMSITPGDYDNDGDIDYFSTNAGIEFGVPHALLRNEGDGSFTEVAAAAGVAAPNFGWGASFADFDKDGDLDLFHNGNLAPVLFGPGANPGRLFLNDGQGNFTQAPLGADLTFRNSSGSAIADFDGDGAVDVAIVATEFVAGGQVLDPGTPVLLHNRGNGRRWLTVRLIGTVSNSQGIGARVTAIDNRNRQVREIAAGSSFASSESPWPTFAVRGDKVDVLVEWPSGLSECFRRVETRTVIDLTEGTGRSATHCG